MESSMARLYRQLLRKSALFKSDLSIIYSNTSRMHLVSSVSPIVPTRHAAPTIAFCVFVRARCRACTLPRLDERETTRSGLRQPQPSYRQPLPSLCARYAATTRKKPIQNVPTRLPAATPHFFMRKFCLKTSCTFLLLHNHSSWIYLDLCLVVIV